MNGMETLLGDPVVETLGWTLVHSLWQLAAVAALLALALRGLRSPSVRYVAATTALALAVALPVGTFAYLSSPGSFEMSVRSVVFPTDDWTVEPATLASSAAFTPVSMTGESAATPIPWQSWIVMLWLAGVVVCAARLLANLRQVRLLRTRGTRELDGSVRAMLQDLCERIGLGRSVQAFESVRVDVPTVIGWLKPCLLLPASTLSGLTPAQLESVLAHELAHVRRHDYLVNLLQNVVETLFFYHPGVWWMSRQMRLERELCCDDRAVAICESRLTYAQALTRLEILRDAPLSPALAATGGSLLARIRRLTEEPPRSRFASTWAAGLVTLAVVTLTAAGWHLSAQDAPPEPPAVETTTEPPVEFPVVPSAPVDRPGVAAAPVVATTPEEEPTEFPEVAVPRSDDAVPEEEVECPLLEESDELWPREVIPPGDGATDGFPRIAHAPPLARDGVPGLTPPMQTPPRAPRPLRDGPPVEFGFAVAPRLLRTQDPEPGSIEATLEALRRRVARLETELEIERRSRRIQGPVRWEAPGRLGRIGSSRLETEPPARDPRSQVTSVFDNEHLAMVNRGAKDGLSVGDTVEIHRTDASGTRHVGRAVVTRVGEKDAFIIITDGFEPGFRVARGDAFTPLPTPLDAAVVAVREEANLVILSVGSDDRVRIGQEFVVYRADRFIAKVKVIKVTADLAGARILVTDDSETIRTGDRATTRLVDRRPAADPGGVPGRMQGPPEPPEAAAPLDATPPPGVSETGPSRPGSGLQIYSRGAGAIIVLERPSTKELNGGETISIIRGQKRVARVRILETTRRFAVAEVLWEAYENAAQPGTGYRIRRKETVDHDF